MHLRTLLDCSQFVRSQIDFRSDAREKEIVEKYTSEALAQTHAKKGGLGFKCHLCNYSSAHIGSLFSEIQYGLVLFIYLFIFIDKLLT